MAAILDFSLYSILHRREDRWKFILGRKYVRKKSTRSINLEMFKEADIIIAMHVIGFQMTFKISIWPLRTLYDICSHLQHQNRVHWPRKWLERCVTLIYSDVIYSPYDRFYQNGGHLGFQPPQPLAQGGKSRKVDFYEGKISVSDMWKNQLSTFFLQVTVVCSLLLLG